MLFLVTKASSFLSSMPQDISNAFGELSKRFRNCNADQAHDLLLAAFVASP